MQAQRSPTLSLIQSVSISTPSIAQFWRTPPFSSCGHIDPVKEVTGNEPSELIFAGGKLPRSLWAQIVADVTGKNVRIPEVKEATALGGCPCRLRVGIYPSTLRAQSALNGIRHSPPSQTTKLLGRSALCPVEGCLQESA